MAKTQQTRSAAGRGEKEGAGKRYLWLVGLFFVAFLVITARFWYLQIMRGDEYWRASSNNIIRDMDLRAPRGNIIDRNGKVMAENRPSFDVFVLPHIFNKYDTKQTLALLQRYLHLSDQEVKNIEKRVQAKVAQVPVRRDVTRRAVAALEADKLRLPGVEVRVIPHRVYPYNQVGAHALGYMAEVSSKDLLRLSPYGYTRGDYIGRMGLERSFEEVLRGSPGIDRRVVDVRGIPQGEAETQFLIGDYRKIAPVPGRDVVTTLDAELMETIDQAVRDYPSGAVVALDPRDGSILALYSKPGINPNSWTGRLSSMEKRRVDNNPFTPMLDKSVNAYFPGSVYKIVGAAAALEEGIEEVDGEITCHGGYMLGGRRFRCWKRGGHGPLDVAGAMQHSCDVYFYSIADRLGSDVLAEYAYKFGFGEQTGISLNNESAGRVPTKEWHRTNSPHGYQHGFSLNTVLGQGNTMSTPLQVALAYGAIANGGDLYYPRIVSEIRNSEGETLFEYPPKVRRTLGLKDSTLAAIKDGLYKVVNENGGTAYALKSDDLEISGKSGTAQVHAIGTVRVANRDKAFQLRDHAWFVAYAPSKDPEIVVAVFLQHAGGGSTEAAPVAINVIKSYLENQKRAAQPLPAQPDLPPTDGDSD
ncbi:penicillin-binding protein 2 [Bradymonas sediminis]|uniref:Penicillin-binding protein 2 n=1 Tax=Bradymonas sediminis TaxID=1548548 RepID=A0A2Z4FJE8_9DELT|nr:penicillin-binding protein 2 [Bradymonas sediminis]AWV89049.1 penicillin-binding protein 2 [Bradymonas sediminis]TDP64491.1 penicillin-binding protein 2 [Bradymonas sediminis]